MASATGPAARPAADSGLPARVSLIVRDTAGSTNALARDLALAGAPAWTAVQARAQTAGRGRRGNAWASPPGNLYISTILRPSAPPAEAARLSLVAALAVADAVAEAAPRARATLKWPNDALLDGRKVAGVLLETVAAPGRAPALVVGVGVNVASHPPDARYGATCLDLAAGRPLSVDRARDLFLSALARRRDEWEAGGFAPVRAAWLARAHGLGRTVEVAGGAGAGLRGRFRGLDGEGRMLVERPDGTMAAVSAGTVSFPGGDAP